MRYTDSIAKSKTDTEYVGGIIFKQLVEEGTIVDFNENIREMGLIVFTLDKFCYTGKTTQADETRAYILIDTPFPMQRSNIRLILCDGKDRKTGKMKLLEVLPAPDPEYPIFGNDWMHKLSWFLKAEAFGINLYEYILARCKDRKYMDAGFDLRYMPIETEKQRINFLDEFWSLVSYVHEQTQRGSSRYGCQQRSRKYADQLSKVVSTVKRFTSPRPSTWGFFDKDTNRFDDPPNYVIMVLDFTRDMVNSNDMTELEFIKTHLEYLVRANKLEFPLPTEVKDQDTLNAYYRSLIEIGKRKKLIYEALKLA